MVNCEGVDMVTGEAVEMGYEDVEMGRCGV